MKSGVPPAVDDHGTIGFVIARNMRTIPNAARMQAGRAKGDDGGPGGVDPEAVACRLA